MQGWDNGGGKRDDTKLTRREGERAEDRGETHAGEQQQEGKRLPVAGRSRAETDVF